MTDKLTPSLTVLLDPSLGHRAPLEAAALLARNLGLRMTVVVLENPDFNALARLPFSRELRISSSAWSAIEVDLVVSSFTAQLRRTERLLRDIANSLDVPWEIKQVRSRYQAAAERFWSDRAVLVLDRPPQVPVNQKRRYRQVLVVFDGNEAVLRAGLVLAQGIGLMMTILVVADNVASFGERRDQARTILESPVFTPAVQASPIPRAAHLPVQWRWQALNDDPAQSGQAIVSRLAHETRASQSLIVLPKLSQHCPVPKALASLNSATIVLVPMPG
ncbi:MAG: hypothetical protein WBD13_07465 [Burkholderiaceae bacterium]